MVAIITLLWGKNDRDWQSLSNLPPHNDLDTWFKASYSYIEIICCNECKYTWREVIVLNSENEIIGRAICAARNLANLDQSEIAKIAKVSTSTISNIERGNIGSDEVLSSVRKAIRKSGISLLIDKSNQSILIALNYGSLVSEEPFGE